MERAFARMRPTALAESVTPGSDAAATLSEILLAAPPKLDTLVAHRRGLAHPLPMRFSAISTISRAKMTAGLAKRLHIVTLGAVVGCRRDKHVKQYLGASHWSKTQNSA